MRITIVTTAIVALLVFSACEPNDLRLGSVRQSLPNCSEFCPISEHECTVCPETTGAGGGGGEEPTGPTPPLPDSCGDSGDFKRCGPTCPEDTVSPNCRPKGVSTTAPLGCSCAPDCGYKGTCCRDVLSVCYDPTDPLGFFYLDGDAFSTYSPEVAVNVRLNGEIGFASRWVAPDSDVLVGLTQAVYAGLSGPEEFTLCSTTHHVLPNFPLWQGWSVDAYGHNNALSHASAQCAGRTIRAKGLQHAGAGNANTASQSAITTETDRTHLEILGSELEGRVVLLSGAQFSDTDGTETAFCEVYTDFGNYYLKANTQASKDADANCWASLWDLGPNVKADESFDASVTGGTEPSGSVDGCEVPTKGVRECEMREEGQYVCFLTKIAITDAKSADEATGCSIVPRNGLWHLRAQARSDSAADCRAQCFEIDGNPYPPKPVRRHGSDGSSFVLYRDRTFNGEQWVTGSYDRPMVFVEGIDPTNRFSAVHYAKEAALMVRALQQLAGFDIWFLDFKEGGAHLEDNARTVAELVHRAHTHCVGTSKECAQVVNPPTWASQNEGKKFPVMGVSMGGILTRIALASWEQGSYGPQGAEAIPGFTSMREPPVSVWLSQAGPHEGAQVPLSAQTIMQILVQLPFGGFGDFSTSEPYLAFNSDAAKDLLTERVTSECIDTFDETVLTTAHVLDMLSGDSSIEVRGTVVFKTIGDDYHPVFMCATTSAEHDQVYAEINAQGARPYGVTVRNGWPQTVPSKVGITNGSWFQQHCRRMPDGLGCSVDNTLGEIVPYQTDFATIGIGVDYPNGLVMNVLSSLVAIATLGQTTVEDPNIRISLLDTEHDVLPGDVAGRGAGSLSPVTTKTWVDVAFQQQHPIRGLRTDSVLACPLGDPGGIDAYASNDETCRASNVVERRFDRVHSNHSVNESYDEIYNGSHDTLEPVLGFQLLAYLYDGRPDGDADGWFTACDPNAPAPTCNPFYRPDLYPGVFSAIEDCDETLHMLNNQCAPAGSCAQRCGGAAEGCFCDEWCTRNGDCCPDYRAACGRGGEYGSCAASCGGLAGGGSTIQCSCAADCGASVPCCPDKITYCGPCNDSLQNGSETDIDCGGTECLPCANGQTCAVGADCASGRCEGGACVASSRGVGGLDYDPYSQALDLALDADGNLVVTGEATGPADLGDAADAPGAGAFDLFVGKYAPDGTHLWSKLVGSLCNDYGRGVATDFDGSVFVGGSVGCGGSVGGPSLAGIEQALVAKYSPAGDHLWSKTFGDDGTDEAVFALETLRTGEVVVAGIFEAATIDFGLGPISNHGSAGSGDVFVAKLARDGSTVWAKAFGGAGYEQVTSLAVDARGYVVVTGAFDDPVDFGMGVLSPVGHDMFALKLSPEGEHVWSLRIGGSDTSITSGHGVAMSSDGDVFLTGSFSGSAEFPPFPCYPPLSFCDFFPGQTLFAQSDDVFVAKFLANGMLAWAQSFTGGGFDEARSIRLDAHGDLLVVGGFNSNSLYLGPTALHNQSDFFGMDVFVAKYDAASGAHLFSTSYPSLGDDRGLALAVHPVSGATVIGGMFTGELDMGAGAMTSHGSFDIFLANLGIVP